MADTTTTTPPIIINNPPLTFPVNAERYKSDRMDKRKMLIFGVVIGAILVLIFRK